MAGSGEGGRAVLTRTAAGPGITDAGSWVLGLRGCRNPWLGAQVCVCVCVFSFFPSSLEASVFFSAEWANYDFGFHFTTVLSEGHFILMTLVFLGIQFLLLFSLKRLTRTSPQARPFLMVGGGDAWHWKAFRDTRFFKFTIFQPPPSPQGNGPVCSWRGTAWEGVLTPLQGGRTPGGGNTLQRHQAPGRPAVAP